jgi:hypothetical protein
MNVVAATTYEVDGVTAFTNAIANAVSGDTIVLAAGTYDLSGLEATTGDNWGTMKSVEDDENGVSCIWIAKNITIKGANEKHWSEKESSEETILDGGNAARIFYGYGANGRRLSFEHITFSNGRTTGNGGGVLLALPAASGSLSNCVFRNCYAANGGGSYHHQAWDCLFENCTATENGGGAFLDGSKSSGVNRFSGDVFRGCSAAFGGGLYLQDLTSKSDDGNTQTGGDYSEGYVADCIISNCTASTAGGGVYSYSSGNIVRLCIFEGNSSSAANRIDTQGGGAMFGGCATNCTFAANSCTNFGGACSHVYAVDCVFTNNFSSGNRGGAMASCTAMRCRFADNYTANASARGGACTHSDCVGCSFSGCGDVSGGSFLNCVFDGVTSHNGNQSYVFGSMYNKGIPLAVTNCLVRGCSVVNILLADGLDAEFVNCTFADNAIDAGGYLFKCQRYKQNDVIYAGTNKVVNCLFSGNTVGGERMDCRIYNQGSAGCATFLVNCLSGSGYVVTRDGVEMTGVVQGAAKFAGASESTPEDVPYYTPMRSSSARDAGLDMEWMTSAVDLAGNRRINGSHVDIGCYESYLDPMGMSIIIR